MRFSRWIWGLLFVSAALSFFFASRGPIGAQPRAECLTDKDCQRSERCVVVPKGDGFATLGQCGERCTSDATCPNGWRCKTWAEGEGFVVPDRAPAAQLARVQVCAHQGVGP